MDDLIERIERLGNATRPDRKFDAAIFALCGSVPDRLRERGDVTMWAEGTDVFWKGGTVTRGKVFKGPKTYPRYTSSFDAALTLVPEDCYVESVYQTPAGWSVSVCDKDKIDNHQKFEGIEMGNPALALCLAALKALSVSRNH